MKNSNSIILSIIILALFAIATITGCKKQTQLTCTDNIKNGSETEIDCGGTCTACPPVGSVIATINNLPFYSVSTVGYGFGNNIGKVSANGNSGSSIEFEFIYTKLDTPLRITSAQFYFSDSYAYRLDDTGSVKITTIDTLRKIFSGIFSFRGTNYYNAKGYAQDGLFTNVRYQ
jgi:hypothetical protein